MCTLPQRLLRPNACGQGPGLQAHPVPLSHAPLQTPSALCPALGLTRPGPLRACRLRSSTVRMSWTQPSPMCLPSLSVPPAMRALCLLQPARMVSCLSRKHVPRVGGGRGTGCQFVPRGARCCPADVLLCARWRMCYTQAMHDGAAWYLAGCLLSLPTYTASGLPMGVDLTNVALSVNSAGDAKAGFNCKAGYTGAITSAICSNGVLSVVSTCTEGGWVWCGQGGYKHVSALQYAPQISLSNADESMCVLPSRLHHSSQTSQHCQDGHSQCSSGR